MPEERENSVNQPSEFLQGPIANEYRDILESTIAIEAATKAGTTGRKCSGTKVCPKPKPNSGKNCSVPNVCPKPNTGKNCSVPKVCPKANTGKNCSVPMICAKAMASGKNCSTRGCREALAPSHLPFDGWSLPPAAPLP